MSRRRTAVLAALLAVALSALVGPHGRAVAQEDAPEGRITGAVVSGTPGAVVDDVSATLIVLEQSEVTGSEEAPVVDGRFEFTVPARTSLTYIVFVRYQGIQYFADPIILEPDEPDATRDITIYETTTETPELSIRETLVTLRGIDRDAGLLFLQREDLVETGGARVYVGNDEGVTLRLPAPGGTVDAGGANEASAIFDGGVVSSTLPLRPDIPTTIVTRYVVQYDPAEDRYLLRVTAPVRAERMEVHVPRGYVSRIEPQEGAQRGDDLTLQNGTEATVLHTVVLDGAAEPGQGLLVDLIGLSGRQESLILTERYGAAGAAAIALALIAGTAIVVLRRRGASA